MTNPNATSAVFPVAFNAGTKVWYIEGDSVANVCFAALLRERVTFLCEPVSEPVGQWWKYTVPADAPSICRPPIARDTPGNGQVASVVKN